MALTLTSAIGPTDRTIAITGTVPDSIAAGYEFRIDDERFVLTTFALEEVAYPGWTQMDPDRNSWIVRRGVAVAHDADSAIKGAVDAFVSAATEVPPTPFASSGGSGGVTVDNQTDPPAEVTTIVSARAIIVGDEATLATDLDASDLVTGATATVVVTAPQDDGTAQVASQALAVGSMPGSNYVIAQSGSGAALVQNTATSPSGTAAAQLDAGSTGGVATSRVAVVDAAGTTVLAGLVATAESGVATSLVITDGAGNTGQPGEVFLGSASGALWTSRAGFFTSVSDFVLGAGVGPTILVTLYADGSFEVGGSGVVRLYGLPTADPAAADQLWNDAGTLKVSAG